MAEESPQSRLLSPPHTPAAEVLPAPLSLTVARPHFTYLQYISVKTKMASSLAPSFSARRCEPPLIPRQKKTAQVHAGC